MFCAFGQADISRPLGNAILSKFPFSLVSEIRLPRGSLYKDDDSRIPGQFEQRLALVAMINPGNELPFNFVSTHIGIYNTSASQPAQNSKYSPSEMPFALIEEFARYSKLPIILAGDFNDHSGGAGLSFLKRNGWNVYESEPTRKNGKIDYFCDRSFGKWALSPNQVIPDEVTNGASDHRPLVSVLTPSEQPKKKCKLVFFVPVENAEEVKNAAFAAGAGYLLSLTLNVFRAGLMDAGELGTTRNVHSRRVVKDNFSPLKTQTQRSENQESMKLSKSMHSLFILTLIT